jgi:hypothetical protein
MLGSKFGGVRTLIGKYLTLLTLCIGISASQAGQTNGLFAAGPLYHEFSMTLAPGTSTEVMGPIFYSRREEDRLQWSIPPLLSGVRDSGTDSAEFDFLYPLLTYDRFGEEYRWQLFQVLSLSGGQNLQDNSRDRFTIFPFYFQQRSKDTSLNYTAIIPIYGNLKNRLLRDEIHFVMMPLYVQTRKRDVVTDNYVYPFFHLRRGNNLSGWQFWPVVGSEHKGTTIRTNNYDEVVSIGGHEKFFAAWPIFLRNTEGIGTTNEVKQTALLPIYSLYRSPSRNSSTYAWPFFTYIDDREKGYQETGLPWPFVSFAWGEGKYTRRVWPLFSRSHNATLSSDFYLWPVYMNKRINAEQIYRERTRIFFFLYSDLVEINPVTAAKLHRTDLWPFFTKRHDLNGNERLQVLAILEPILPNNKSIERNYSHLWSLWRQEFNAKTGTSSKSLLWNLYREDKTETTKKGSLFFGLFQYESTPEGTSRRWFFLPAGKDKKASEATPKP